jgi:hypothetical protein
VVHGMGVGLATAHVDASFRYTGGDRLAQRIVPEWCISGAVVGKAGPVDTNAPAVVHRIH